MSREDVVKYVKDVFSNNSWNNVELDDCFKSDLGMNSLDVVNIIFDLESNVQDGYPPLCIPSEDVDNWETVRDVVDTICKCWNVE